MRVEFLGTGGAITTPRPNCHCRVCSEARQEGVPYSRAGPSLFVHGPDVLIDTPEEIKHLLDRSSVRRIEACIYSHWHPDHVMGRRVWEMNKDWRGWPPRNACTDVYVPRRVASDFRQHLGTWDHLAFLEQQGLVRLIEIQDGDSILLGSTSVTPLPLAEEYAFAFLLARAGQKLLIVPDELRGWEPPPAARGVDLAVVPMGVLEFDPLSGERRMSAQHSVLRSEATFRETLEIIEVLDARRVVMTHIEEPDAMSYDDLLLVERRVREAGVDLTFAFDTRVVEV